MHMAHVFYPDLPPAAKMGMEWHEQGAQMQFFSKKIFCGFFLMRALLFSQLGACACACACVRVCVCACVRMWNVNVVRVWNVDVVCLRVCLSVCLTPRHSTTATLHGEREDFDAVAPPRSVGRGGQRFHGRPRVDKRAVPRDPVRGASGAARGRGRGVDGQPSHLRVCIVHHMHKSEQDPKKPTDQRASGNRGEEKEEHIHASEAEDHFQRHCACVRAGVRLREHAN